MGAKVFQKAKQGTYYRGVKNLKNWNEFGRRLGSEFVIQHAVFPHEGGGGINRLRTFRRAKVLGKCFVDLASMFRELWDCGLCVWVCVRWSKGGAKIKPEASLF